MTSTADISDHCSDYTLNYWLVLFYLNRGCIAEIPRELCFNYMQHFHTQCLFFYSRLSNRQLIIIQICPGQKSFPFAFLNT